MANTSNSPASFSHITIPELWLPIAFDTIVEAPDPSGAQTKIGSVPILWDQLQLLNTRTWSADPETIPQWNTGDSIEDESPETLARWGFSIWYPLVEFAVRHRLPTCLDY